MVDARLRRMLEARSAARRRRQRPARLVRLAADHRGPAQPRSRARAPGQPRPPDRRRPPVPALAGRRARAGRPGAARRPRRRAGRAGRPGLAARRRRRRGLRPGHRGARRSSSSAADGLVVCGGGCMGFVHPGRGRARDRLPRARPAAAGAGRAGHPLGLGVLRDAAHPPPPRVRARGLLGPGAGHRRRRLPRLRPRPSPETRVVGLVLETLRDAGRHARRAGPGRRAGRAGGGADGRLLDPRPRPGRRPLRSARGQRRRVGGALRGVRRAPGRRPRRADRQPRGVRDRPAGAGATRRARDRARLGRASGCSSPTSPSGSACRSPRSPRRPSPGWRACSSRGSQPTNPLDVWGTGAGSGVDPHRLPRGARRRRRGRRGRAGRRPGAGVRRRRGLPARPRAARARTRPSRWSCWPTCRRRSTSRSPPSCGHRASRCSRAPGRGCARCGHLLAHARPPTAPRRRSSTPTRQAHWSARLAAGEPVDALALAAAYGVPVVALAGRHRRRRGGARSRRARTPGRAQDRDARGAAQGRRRRRPARPGRRGRGGRGVRRPRGAARARGAGAAPGASPASRWRSGSTATRSSARCWSSPPVAPSSSCCTSGRSRCRR